MTTSDTLREHADRVNEVEMGGGRGQLAVDEARILGRALRAAADELTRYEATLERVRSEVSQNKVPDSVNALCDNIIAILNAPEED